MGTGRGPLQLVVRKIAASSTRGVLEAGTLRLPCAIGRSGVSVRKQEGDGASPAGAWLMRFAYYRADRIVRPRTGLPLRAVSPQDGWCDAPTDRNYNRPVRHPYPASAERLWRADGLYDVIVVLSHNERPRKRGAGSAVFLHCARDDMAPTEGCIAVRRADLVRLLARTGRGSRIVIS